MAIWKSRNCDTDAYRDLARSSVSLETREGAKVLSLPRIFVHPERCIYLLGAEDYGLPDKVLSMCQAVVHISTPMCLNVAVDGSIVMYDRKAKD